MMQCGSHEHGFRIGEGRFRIAAQFQEVRRASRNFIIDRMGNKGRQKIERLFLVSRLCQYPNFQVRPNGCVQVSLFRELASERQCLRDAAQAANQNIGIKQIITHAAPFAE